ncbi:glutamate--tRNA ligase [Novipirellula artificiosorum]|uniref:Glutamate--tRNA ligase n=1 Tax=Novipirellula artificiosorum TaxID=2528016 RepID=A0A5C6DBU7_9BACT|nr:glutamate--tRNA ligase [Novipirellula artificiosorum]TWU34240.1 Glutamate--tRNA ligase 1 [Novipirellula artificiosorum]
MIRTRFAPSPTGYLHIGGVRTALFNWLIARQSGGQFVLRIDDTDSGRNVAEAIKPILEGFRWLGMNWEEGPETGGPHEPYYQSQRAERYAQAAAKLLQSGHAYRDYAKPEEFNALRQEAEKAKVQFIYDRRWMAADDAAAAAFEAEGRTAVVRLKMPREGQCVISDRVRGEVRVDWASEQDHVIQRADGSCLYHLASVVDDHDFEISHVIRSEEHLSNTPRQIYILESLGYERPIYAHLPYVAEPGGHSKLSKRKLAKYQKNKDFAQLLDHGQRIAERCGIATEADTFNPVIIDFYREIGFTADAILNYLLLLGWSLDGEREKFTVEEMTKLFSLERVTKSPASFDPQKLLSFQGDVFAALSLETRIANVMPFAVAAGLVESGDADAASKLGEVVQAAGDRLKIAGDILDFDYCFVDEFDVDEKAYQKRIEKPESAKPLLGKLRACIDNADRFDAVSAETLVKQFCEDEGIKLGDIIHALRVATTGRAAGFGMFETLAVIGKDKVAERIGKVASA